jgi:hypothetical protein
MTHHRTLSIGALLVLLTLASNPSAQRYDDAAAVAPEVHRLKSAYLRCDQSASERMLGVGEAANCSLVHELLLRLGFGGDFERLLAWWRAERATAAARRDAQASEP